VVTIHPRYRWRYLCGYVHPASGRTQWHLGSGISVELYSRSLAAFAQQAGAGPTKELVVVVDQAGWHMSPRLVIPPHVHLVPLPPLYGKVTLSFPGIEKREVDEQRGAGERLCPPCGATASE
jgi:hypothetical protein